MKALPALGFTLKHDTVSSFVKGLAAYCEQNNIGPLVIENNVDSKSKSGPATMFTVLIRLM
jgi:hypothetical protein